MDRDLKQFIEQAKKIKLSQEERSVIKNSVLNFISQNPVRSNIHPRLNYGSNIFLTKLSFVPTMAILLIITVLVGGGVAVGAEKALPGDILYPVKVGVNEEVAGWLKISDESKADWDIKRTERRLEEAELLADEGSLDTEASQKIEANFEAHAQKVKDRVEKFNSKENFNAAASVSLNFETALKAHDRILSKLAKKKGDVEVQLKPIRAKIRSEFKDSVQERKRVNGEIKSQTGGRTKVDNDNEDEDEDIDSEIDSEINTESDINSDDGSIETEGRLKVRLGI